MSVDVFEVVPYFPQNVYVMGERSRRGSSAPEFYRVDDPLDVLDPSGRFHHLVCGDIGFPSRGDIQIWLVHTAGPLVKFLRTTAATPRGSVILAGLATASVADRVTIQPSAHDSTTECLFHSNVSLLCVAPEYRNAQHGRQLWKSLEQLLIADTLAKGHAMPSQCDQHVLVLHLNAVDNGWKFWQRLGFTGDTIVMGTVPMQKAILVSASPTTEEEQKVFRSAPQPVRRSTRAPPQQQKRPRHQPR